MKVAWDDEISLQRNFLYWSKNKTHCSTLFSPEPFVIQFRIGDKSFTKYDITAIINTTDYTLITTITAITERASRENDENQ